MNIIRPGIFDVGIFFCRELSFSFMAYLISVAMNTLFYVNWENLKKIVSRPDNLERLTTNKL